MTGSLSPRAARAPTMLASAPSARWVWPRITPGFCEKVFFTRSSNSRMRTIWAYIQTRRSLDKSVFNDIGHNLRSELRSRCFRLSDVAQNLAHGNLGRFRTDDAQQHALGGRIQFVAHFFSFQFHQRLAQFHEFAFALQPAHHVDLGGVHAAGFGNSYLGSDGAVPPIARKFAGSSAKRG